jgi:uncharacterized protein YndB with AHSA1/START domain
MLISRKLFAAKTLFDLENDSMLIAILGGLSVFAVMFLVIVASRPGDFRITRSTTISAPPGSVFPHVNDLRKWEAWSPWAKLDPSMKQTFDGPLGGVGATTHWIGNKQVGEGRMTIIESRPNELIRIKLEFLKPFKATNIAEFTFAPQGNQTAVNWSMTGSKNFIMKAFCMFMDMDNMVGKDFEKGLVAMKTVVEQSPAQAGV